MSRYRMETDKLKNLKIHDTDLEIDTLACIVWNAENYSKILLLEEEDFYNLKNKNMFLALKEIYERDGLINLSIVSSALKHDTAFIELINRGDKTISSHINHNIKRLKELRASRDIQTLSYEATVKISQGDDPAEVKEWLAREIDMINQSSDKKEITNDELEKRFDDMIDDSNEKPITSGFIKLDEKTGGFDKGTLTIIAAAQGVGKTTMALNLLDHFCRMLKIPVLYASLEMTFDTLYLMSVSRLSGVPYFKIKHKKKDISDSDWSRIMDARAKVSEFNVIRMGEEEISTNDIRYKIKERKPAIVIIDYLQRIKSKQRFNSEYEKLTNISGELQALAKEFNIPVIVIASINRKYSERPDNTPRISDIRGSGSIEFDADTVLLLHRDSAFGTCMNGNVNKFKYGGNLYIAKNRFGESNKAIDIYFDGSIVLMREWQEGDGR